MDGMVPSVQLLSDRADLHVEQTDRQHVTSLHAVLLN